MVVHCRAKGATGAPTALLLYQQVTVQRPNYEPSGREFESSPARHLLLTGHVVREGWRPLGSDPTQSALSRR